MNNMASENDLQANETLLIPRQTPTAGPSITPSPTPGEGTPTADPNVTQEYAGCSVENRCMSPDGQYWLHEVVEGDTCAQIAVDYDTTVPDVLRENNLGDSCLITPGDILRVTIRVTLTPTLTPTGGPDSTSTPTPTLRPPALVAPPSGTSIARSEQVVLQWAANQPLDEDQTYLVQITNTNTGEEQRITTPDTIYRVSEDMRPGPGQSVTFEWRVVIVADDENSPVISGQPPSWTFTWGS